MREAAWCIQIPSHSHTSGLLSDWSTLNVITDSICRSRAERRFWSSYIQNAHNIAQHQSVCHGFEVSRALQVMHRKFIYYV